MRISIFGMGYVGAVCTACLGKGGHRIIGVDISENKVDMINAGLSPIVEPGLEALLGNGVKKGLISATTNSLEAVADTDMSFICVGTPSLQNGSLNLDYIDSVCQQIGEAIAAKDTFHTVVVRSTVLPGTVLGFVLPILESCSGLKAGVDFGLAVNPEFLRESTAIKDYENPPMTVIGAMDDISAAQLESLYSHLDAPLLTRPVPVAEMVKYTCNAWHAVKVAFANEIGSLSKVLEVDGRDVMDIICMDKVLNISPYYMRPGFAFGGSCLPKDVRALNYKAKQLDLSLPLISSIMESNQNQVRKAYTLLSSFDKRRIGMLGLSFKAGTDDLRESPLVELAEMLIGKGYDLQIYDENVKYASVHGANKEFINSRIPHVSSLLKENIDSVLDHADVLVLGNSDPSFKKVVSGLNGDKHLVDLVGFMQEKSLGDRQGICW